MRKLSKSDLDRRDALQTSLETAITAYNEALEAAREAFREVETLVADANDFRMELRDQMQDYFDEKSEKWQEGDNGSDYADWMDAWDQEFIVDEPVLEDLECPDLTELATEPGC